ncbi:DNA alkylation repair protein [Leptospira johnsonii]|uniref:DNA alkylation repair enzyme domain protein n=1 Tax=Leptospira johnsonii TaxID=1917820 RepID=A0A2P2D1E3_9LEPT|nr:DNA alkylation repair protein [Leptospira johnsonii]GBF38463.1 DNA alkylation repair enzyme domain protein [Leptospira johnsonii]
MAEALKNFYNDKALLELGTEFSTVLSHKRPEDWVQEIKRKDWKKLELKQRINRIAEVLSNSLPKPFPKAVSPLLKISKVLEKKFSGTQRFYIIFLGETVEISGIDYPEESLYCMEKITQIISCEFSIREFLIRYPDIAWKKMLEWSKHSHPGTRRLASEGSRPRLPWGKGIPGLKKDPERTLSILENLKNDPDEVVRRSVANHLNDISKDHPDLVISIAKKWMGKSENTDLLLKHALRGLLKQGNSDTLSIFGFAKSTSVKISKLDLQPKIVEIGKHLVYRFELRSEAKEPTLYRLESKIHYLKPSGKFSTKVFQIEEREFSPKETKVYERKQSFQQMTTRIHSAGIHKLEIIVNGETKAKADFNVSLPKVLKKYKR